MARNTGAEASVRLRWAIFIALAGVLRLLLAAIVTDFVLVDDAYITLRYARHLAVDGSLVYNAGEPVFGVTSPTWAFVTALLVFVFGAGGVEVAVVTSGIVLWSLAAWRLTSAIDAPFRNVVIPTFLLAPVFVDNQLLGMETPLFVWLAVHALAAAQEGRLQRAASWTGLLVVTRPEGILFAPALLHAGASSIGWRALGRELRRPSSVARLAGPGLAWVVFAVARYGTFVPQSMVAKSGWNSAHYETLATLETAWFGLARLTFLPFVDHLPRVAAHGATAAIAVLVLATVVLNVRSGTTRSRTWCIAYLTYIAFYLVGKGATEASWYAVPPSVALLLALEPAVPTALADSRRWVVPGAVVLAAFSVGLATRRARLLHSYVAGYGACAAALEEHSPGGNDRVLVGEIGVFGYRTTHGVIDVGALVSPQVLPLKNGGISLVGLARATEADWLVISDGAIERNRYPTVGPVWANEGERRWLESAATVRHAGDKRLLRLERSGGSGKTPPYLPQTRPISREFP